MNSACVFEKQNLKKLLSLQLEGLMYRVSPYLGFCRDLTKPWYSVPQGEVQKRCNHVDFVHLLNIGHNSFYVNYASYQNLKMHGVDVHCTKGNDASISIST